MLLHIGGILAKFQKELTLSLGNFLLFKAALFSSFLCSLTQKFVVVDNNAFALQHFPIRIPNDRNSFFKIPKNTRILLITLAMDHWFRKPDHFQKLQTTIFFKISKFLSWGNSNRSKTTPKFFSNFFFNKYCL